MGNIFLLAVASALFPLLLVAVLAMLNTPRPKALLAGYLLGASIVSVGLGVAIVVVLDRTGVVSGSTGRTVSPAVDIAAGALALFVALAMTRGWDRRLSHRRPKKPGAPAEDSKIKEYLARGSPRLAFLVGMALSLPSFYYLAALKDIAKDWGTSAAAFGLILAFNAIQFLLVEVPLVGYMVAPKRTHATVENFNRWFQAHLRQIGELVAAVIGAYLVIRGIVDLVD
jgi:hypothetical protein